MNSLKIYTSRKLGKLLITFLLLAITGLLILWGTRNPQQNLLPYNILWLTAESTRPRQLEPYGYPLKTSPNIKRFAESGTLFQHAYNPSGWTSENMVSNLVGVNSLVHKVHSRNQTTPPEWYTALEILSDLGMSIGSVQAFHKIPGYQNIGLTDGDESSLLSWLKLNKDKQFFIWYHMLEAHLPYNPASRHRDLFWKKDYIRNRESLKRIQKVMSQVTVTRDEVKFVPEEDQKAIEALYNADIHAMDNSFGEILKSLEDLGLREKTLVILTADHGEELLDHGFIGHASTAKGGTLYDEIIHVPLIMSLPGVIPANKVVSQQVRGLDIMPTVFEILGLEPSKDFDGESLIPFMQADSQSLSSRIAFASSSYKGYQEDNPDSVRDFMRTVRTSEWKLFYRIWNLDKEEFYLYNLVDDPGEQKNVAMNYPEKLEEMKQLLFSWVESSKLKKMTLEKDKTSNVLESFTKTLASFLPTGSSVDESMISQALSPPHITHPREGEILFYDTLGGEVHFRWEGKERVPYLVQVIAGETTNAVELTLNSIGPEVSRKIDRSYWDEYIKIYKTAKFRVKIDRPEHTWSDWRRIEMR